MSQSSAIVTTWDGESFVPLRRFARVCDAEFTVGETYRVTLAEERSLNSHNHYFATIADAWSNLPEKYDGRFADPEHLRKFALIKARYYDQRSIVCASKAEARRVAAFIAPMDDFAVVTVNEAEVVVYTAKSQSRKAMGAKVFQESKQAVLDVVSYMLGVTATQLAAQEKAA